METTSPLYPVITPSGPENIIKINGLPGMGLIFLKALLISPFRPNTLSDQAIVKKSRIELENVSPDPDVIRRYRTICGFGGHAPGIIPITYMQTLFIGLLGRFITSSFFPINPMGLIQVFQSFEQTRPIKTGQNFDLSCILSGFEKKETGIKTRFLLEARSGNEPVWQGVSAFFTRSGKKKTGPASKKADEIFLEKREIIHVPSGTGRRYASVSGDYNPHHLYPVLAKCLGFKTAIAHGMWSLARVAASLDREFDLHKGAARIEASFKLPVFMPAVTALGWEAEKGQDPDQTMIHFELRDEQKGLPHLKGRVFLN